MRERCPWLRETPTSSAAAAARTARASGSNARNYGAVTEPGVPGTAGGTTSSNSRRAPTAPAAPRCAGAGSIPRPAPSRNCGQARELLAIAAPGDTETAIRIADAITKSVRETGQLPDPGRVRKAVGGGHDPAVRPPTVGEWLEEWLAAKKNLRPGTARGYASHIRLYYQPHIGYISIDRLRVTDVASVFEAIDELNEAITAARTSGDPARPRRGQRPPPRRGRHPAADPRHAALGDQHLHETAPGHAARQRRLTCRAARRGPAQAAGLDRRTRPGLAERLRNPPRRRAGTRARRAGQPARHLDLHPPPVPGHGLDPGPDPGLPRQLPPGTACTRCGG